MKRNTVAIKKYALFGSRLRGEAYVERYLEQLLHEMETNANLLDMANQLKAEWSSHQQGVTLLTEAFGGEMLTPSKEVIQVAKARPRLLSRPAFKCSSRKVIALWG